MTIGRDNKIFQFASLGEISQDMSARPDDATRVEIGDGNTIREYVTIQRGTLKEAAALTDRKRVVQGQSVSVRVDPGGRSINKKKKHYRQSCYIRLDHTSHTYSQTNKIQTS